MRPNTEGCTEQTCPYHGIDNRLKAKHGEHCDLRLSTGFVVNGKGAVIDPTLCTCDWRTK